jgi:hypothetical protein
LQALLNAVAVVIESKEASDIQYVCCVPAGSEHIILVVLVQGGAEIGVSWCRRTAKTDIALGGFYNAYQHFESICDQAQEFVVLFRT